MTNDPQLPAPEKAELLSAFDLKRINRIFEEAKGVPTPINPKGIPQRVYSDDVLWLIEIIGNLVRRIQEDLK